MVTGCGNERSSDAVIAMATPGEPIFGKVLFALTVNGISVGIITNGDWQFFVGAWREGCLNARRRRVMVRSRGDPSGERRTTWDDTLKTLE